MALFDSDEAESGIDRIRLALEEADRSHARAVKAAWVAAVVLTASVGLLFGGSAMLRARATPERQAALSSAAGATEAGLPVEPDTAPKASDDQTSASQTAQASKVESARGAKARNKVGRTSGEMSKGTEAAPPRKASPGKPRKSAVAVERQRLSIAIGETGYEPSSLSARAGTPITLVVEKGEGCAAGFLIPALGVNLDNSRGSVSIDLGVLRPGTYTFTCGMSMVEGRLIVRS